MSSHHGLYASFYVSLHPFRRALHPSAYPARFRPLPFQFLCSPLSSYPAPPPRALPPPSRLRPAPLSSLAPSRAVRRPLPPFSPPLLAALYLPPPDPLPRPYPARLSLAVFPLSASPTPSPPLNLYRPLCPSSCPPPPPCAPPPARRALPLSIIYVFSKYNSLHLIGQLYHIRLSKRERSRALLYMSLLVTCRSWFCGSIAYKKD